MILDGMGRRYSLDEVQTPGGLEYRLTSPWDTLIHSWDEHPPIPEVKFRAVKWAALHPESERPAEPVELPRLSALGRLRNRLAKALWVR